MRPDRAFILIELLAVVVIMAIVVGAAHLSLRGVGRHVSFEEAAARLISFDHAARTMARRLGQTAQVYYRHDTLQLAWLNPDGPRAPAPLQLPQAFTLRDQGDVLIGPGGRSRSYALCLRGPDQQERWILFAGLSGIATVMDHEEQTRAILDQEK
jgi:type II secretory pathway pseudopilin PulG